MAAIMVGGMGVRPGVGVEEVKKAVASGHFFWLDIVGESDTLCTSILKTVGLDSAEIVTLLRFKQTGRMRIARDRVRAVTWLSGRDGALVEVHLEGCPTGIVTVWNGDPAVLDAIRLQFADRVGGIEADMHYQAGLLLQLLMGTLDVTIELLDAQIDELRMKVDRHAATMDYSLISRSLQRLQTSAANFSRFAGAVRSAMVGIETLPGVSARAAAELNDYVDLVEDFEEQLYERRRWLGDVTHDFANAVAQRQSDQISRLTIVSMIFLPFTALTGYFGMNFDWLNQRITSEESFFIFGAALPLVVMILTVIWLARRGLVRLDLF